MVRCFQFTRGWAILLLIFAFATAGAFSDPALAVELFPGDIVITAQIGPPVENGAQENLGLLRVDPITGNRTVIADNTHGAGDFFQAPWSVSYAPDGTLIVNDQLKGIYRVNPATGDRVRIQGGLVIPDAIQIGDELIRNSSQSDALSAYNLVTSQGRTLLAPPGSPRFTFTNGMAASGDGLYVAGVPNFGENGRGIFHIDLLTGHRTLISGQANNSPTILGAGPFPITFWDLATDKNGDLFVSSLDGQVFHIDVATGDRTLVSTFVIPDPVSSTGIAVEESGRILLAGYLPTPGLFGVDPITGQQSILSDDTHGAGPSFRQSYGVLVIPNVPEPASVVLAVIGMLGLLACYRAR